jgi:L-histidine Nalpha-methyltransferase
MPSAGGTITIDCRLADGHAVSIADEVRDGLGRPLKELPPKYFYDARGSELFDRITELPEYYPTRCERAILNRHAPQIVAWADAFELVELGSGSASKTRALLFAMAGAGMLSRYTPFDCDEAVVERSALELTECFPGLEVHGVVGDFTRHLGGVPAGGRRLVAFHGGTIGNLHPGERARFLDSVRAMLGPADHFLLGTDLVKDRGILEAAYNDSQGVTAEFNRNMLHVLNNELGANFEPERFEHVAFFDPDESWIEMRLRARGRQRVHLEGAELDVEFADGEEIRTEISTKFTPEAIEQELEAAGMQAKRFFSDDAGLFAVTLAAPAPARP